MMKGSKRCILKLLLSLVAFFLVSQYINAQVAKPWKVLFLNSYHKGYKWSDDITRGIEKGLDGQVGELHIEYLDTKRQYNDIYLQTIANLLKLKHKNHQYNVVITSDDNAFNFALQYRDEILKGIPLVFCGVNYFYPENYDNLKNVTGINEVADLESNFKLIQDLHLECERILVVTDNTTTGKQVVKKVKQLKKKNDNSKVSIELIYDVTEEEMIGKLNDLPSNSIVLYTFFFKDKNGKFFDFIKGTRLICDNSKQPVYGTWGFSMGHGVAGGYLEHGFTQGVAAAERTLEILNGSKVADLPIVSQTSAKLQFDYRVLKQFNIEESLLPESSEILFRPESFYETNKLLIWQVVVLIVVLIVFILVLVIALSKTRKIKRVLEEQNKHLIKTESELNKHKANLENLVKERTSEIEQLNRLLLDKNKKFKIANEQLVGKKSELENIINELRQTQNQLVQSEKMASIGVLTAGIAHEINNPLNFIVSGLASLEIVLEDLTSYVKSIDKDKTSNVEYNTAHVLSATESVPDLINAIRIGVDRTTEIVLGLKKFSRIDEGEKHLADLHELIESSLIILKNKLKHRIEIIKKYDELPQIYCFTSKLAQVFLNILINAIQSIQNKGVISIETSLLDRNKVLVKIQDNGAGIPKQFKDKIFDPFFTTKAVGEGTGLGLSIVHGIINEHNGTIALDSEENIGTTVTIQLPVNSVVFD